MFWSELFYSWVFFCTIFSFWDRVNLVLNIRSVLVCDLDIFRKKKMMLEGLCPLNTPLRGVFDLQTPRPQAPDAFGLNIPSQLVFGHHWLAFHNQVRKNLQVPDKVTTNVEYKIYHISKSNNRIKRNSREKIFVSEHCTSFY